MILSNKENPFQTDRWEDEINHLFWLPSLFDDLERNRSLYLIGTRGSGKTTMLRALDWKERLTNESLQSQIRNRGDDFFSKRFIGIYIDVSKKYILKNYYFWIKNTNQSDEQIKQERGRLFSLYIEYLALYFLIDAIENLRTKKYFAYTADQEQKIVNEIIKIRPEVKLFIGGIFETNHCITIDTKKGNKRSFDSKTVNEDNSLSDLKNAIKIIYEKIWNDSLKEPPKESSDLLIRHPIGSILSEISKCLLELCNQKNKKFYVKVCIDGVESLDPEFITALNTLIASQEEHTTFVFASTHDFIDKETTFIPNHPLTADDRDIISLDNFYKKQKNFLKFSEEVTKLRFERVLGHTNFDVNLKNLLGDYSINELLDYEFNGSITIKNKKFVSFVKNEFSPKWNLLMQSLGRKKILRSPPYTQAYLSERLKIDLNDYIGKKNDFYVLEKTVFNKRVVSAMLSLLFDNKSTSEYRLPYAGYKIIINLSDSNIRDYLRQMRFIYEKSPNKLEKFFDNTVSIDNQENGVLSASQFKYNEIERGSSFAIEIKNLVHFLGDLTHTLQTKSPNALITTERGTYIINYSALPSLEEKIMLQKIMFNASVRKYYVKIINEKENPNDHSIVIQKIRLHKLFSPLFNFSYRATNAGSRYELELNPKILLDICNSPEKDDYFNIIEKILKRTQKRNLKPKINKKIIPKKERGKQSKLSRWTKKS